MKKQEKILNTQQKIVESLYYKELFGLNTLPLQELSLLEDKHSDNLSSLSEIVEAYFPKTRDSLPVQSLNELKARLSSPQDQEPNQSVYLSDSESHIDPLSQQKISPNRQKPLEEIAQDSLNQNLQERNSSEGITICLQDSLEVFTQKYHDVDRLEYAAWCQGWRQWLESYAVKSERYEIQVLELERDLPQSRGRIETQEEKTITQWSSLNDSLCLFITPSSSKEVCRDLEGDLLYALQALYSPLCQVFLVVFPEEVALFLSKVLFGLPLDFANDSDVKDPFFECRLWMHNWLYQAAPRGVIAVGLEFGKLLDSTLKNTKQGFLKERRLLGSSRDENHSTNLLCLPSYEAQYLYPKNKHEVWKQMQKLEKKLR